MPSLEAQARREAQRLASLWRIVNSPNLRGENLVRAMLGEAAVAMRPGHAYAGTLGHVEGPEFVLDAVAGQFGADGDSTRVMLPIGLRIKRSDSVNVRDLDAGRTQSWEDCQALADLPERTRAGGIRSQIATQFVVGGTIHVLTFGTREPPAGMPFGPEDYAYVELLASFFARQLELEEVEASLIAAELSARRHSERLKTLWRIANNPTLSGAELMLAMLQQASAEIRPPQRFQGQLGRIEGEDMVILAVGSDPDTGDGQTRGLRAGQRKPLALSIVPRTGRTQAWEDLTALDEPPEAVSRFGWRAIVTTRFEAGGAHHVLAFASNEPAIPPFSAGDLAYVEALGASFAKRLEVDQLAESLRAEEERTRGHAERLEALWQITNNPTLRGEELMLAMLRQAAAAIFPAQRFRGVLGRIEGDEVVVIGLGLHPDDPVARPQQMRIGRRVPLAQTVIPRVSRTQAWEDLAGDDDAPSGLPALGWRAVISTQFQAGGSRYSLTFASLEPAANPFTPEDLSYIDVLASSFAKQLEVDRLGDSLRAREESARQHSARLEALWNIANDPSLREDELLRAMLAEVATALGPNAHYRGMLWRTADTDMVLEALAPGDQLFEGAGKVGDALSLAKSIVGQALAENAGTCVWEDLQRSGESGGPAVAGATRSLILRTFVAGATTWGLLFTSTAAASTLEPQDHAYIEVVSSFFANHVQQRWQFERIAYQQSHDVLTGLLNRSQFRSQARSSARTRSHYAIILIDIDAFREINESYGHMVGDALLVEVANALRLRASDDEILGRIGDDVFGIYIDHPDSKEFVLSRALGFAEAFTRGFSAGDREGTEFIARTAGLGIAVAPDDGTHIDAILARADAALVRAKQRGRSSIVFYDPSMEGDAHRRTALRNELAEAVAENQFELYYQPHIDVESSRITGCEALIRWNHPSRGLLLPQHFIPFAEQSGIITSIDSWVMQSAFAAANDLGSTHPDFRLYFNLSGRQAGDPKLIRSFVAAARSGVALEHVGVEITETDAMRDVEATRHVCRALRRLNVKIAIDDFGTGYSSLSSLKQLPVDIIKIDRSFISGVTTNPHDATIADTIISIAARFGFDALAEGVEQLGEIDWLRRRSCRYMQGYAICHPLPIDAFESWLEDYGMARFA